MPTFNSEIPQSTMLIVDSTLVADVRSRLGLTPLG